MATRTDRPQTIAPQLEVSVHWASSETPVVARLELAQARELIGRLSLMTPEDPAVIAAMQGTDASRLLLGLQAFHRIVLNRDGCIALADVDGGVWTIPARSVDAIRVRLVAGITQAGRAPDPVALQRAFASADGNVDPH